MALSYNFENFLEDKIRSHNLSLELDPFQEFEVFFSHWLKANKSKLSKIFLKKEKEYKALPLKRRQMIEENLDNYFFDIAEDDDIISSPLQRRCIAVLYSTSSDIICKEIELKATQSFKETIKEFKQAQKAIKMLQASISKTNELICNGSDLKTLMHISLKIKSNEEAYNSCPILPVVDYQSQKNSPEAFMAKKLFYYFTYCLGNSATDKSDTKPTAIVTDLINLMFGTKKTPDSIRKLCPPDLTDPLKNLLV